MGTALFWVVTQLVVGNSLPTFRDNLPVPSSRVKKASWHLQRPVDCPETSVRNYHRQSWTLVSVKMDKWSPSVHWKILYCTVQVLCCTVQVLCCITSHFRTVVHFVTLQIYCCQRWHSDWSTTAHVCRYFVVCNCTQYTDTCSANNVI